MSRLRHKELRVALGVQPFFEVRYCVAGLSLEICCWANILEGDAMLKQAARHVVTRAIVLLALMVASIALVAPSTQCAYADEMKKPDGLQVLVNGQPYSGFDIAKGYYNADQEKYGDYYYEASLNGAKVSIGNLPKGWYILSFNVSTEYGTQTYLTVGDDPIYDRCSTKYSWGFKGATVERTLNEISNARIYFDYSKGDIWNDDPANWVEPEGFNPLEDYNAPEYLLPKGWGVDGISDYGWLVDNESLEDSAGNPSGTIYTVHPRGADSPKVTWRVSWSKNAGKPVNPSQPKVLTRINGATRYQTMSGLVDLMGASKNGVVVVASAANYPDALAASSLAGCYDPAPILLTDPNSLTEEVGSQIKKLNPSFIYIVGGESAVSSTVEDQLKGISQAYIQRLSGQTRYETSLRIAKTAYSVANGGGEAPWQVVIATGANFADALSVSSYAYAGKLPILLCDPVTGLSDDALAFLKDKGIRHAMIVGGNQAVPASVESQLKTVDVSFDRYSGNTRYETSVKIAERASSIYNNSSILGLNGSIFATGKNFPDALAAGPVAGHSRSFVLLVDDGNDAAIRYAQKWTKDYGSRPETQEMVPTTAYIAGGVNAVGNSTAIGLSDAMDLQIK